MPGPYFILGGSAEAAVSLAKLGDRVTAVIEGKSADFQEA